MFLIQRNRVQNLSNSNNSNNLNNLNNLKISNIVIKNLYFSIDQVLNKVEETIKNNGKIQIVTLNPEMVIDSLYNSVFLDILNNSEVILESNGVCFYVNKRYNLKINPINGIDLAESIISKSYRVFILGTKQEILEKAVINLKNKYPNSNIVGFYNGYFEKDQEIIDLINSKDVEVLLVGLGSPKQEFWIYNNINKINANVFIGIGGSIDVWGEHFKRAPYIFRKFKLEWLYRTIQDPKRIKRNLKLFKFLFYFFIKKI
ncbi:MAG: WecB/TagA/CpsF family glycosyltransferase [bacterium]